MDDKNDKIEAVQRMQDYIDGHLCEVITLSDLSRASLFSPWYCHRLFAQHTGMTPSDYIRRLRLSRSALRLRDEECKVLDVAIELGFGSVDGYQRAFLREFGRNPREYAKSPAPIYLFTPYGVKYKQIRRYTTMESTKSIFVQIVEKPERKVIIKRGVKADDYFAYCEEVGCDVWGLLTSIKSIGGEPVSMWLPARFIAPGTSRYVQGAEVPADYDGDTPEGFDVIKMPAAKFLMFTGEPFAEEDYCQAIEQLQAATAKYNPAAIGMQWDDSNPRIQLEPRGERGYMELLPIKPVER